jgi:hypothetical protein
MLHDHGFNSQLLQNYGYLKCSLTFKLFIYFKKDCTAQFGKTVLFSLVMFKMTAISFDAYPALFDYEKCNLTKNCSVIWVLLHQKFTDEVNLLYPRCIHTPCFHATPWTFMSICLILFPILGDNIILWWAESSCLHYFATTV